MSISRSTIRAEQHEFIHYGVACGTLSVIFAMIVVESTIFSNIHRSWLILLVSAFFCQFLYPVVCPFIHSHLHIFSCFSECRILRQAPACISRRAEWCSPARPGCRCADSVNTTDKNSGENTAGQLGRPAPGGSFCGGCGCSQLSWDCPAHRSFQSGHVQVQ